MCNTCPAPRRHLFEEGEDEEAPAPPLTASATAAAAGPGAVAYESSGGGHAAADGIGHSSLTGATASGGGSGGPYGHVGDHSVHGDVPYARGSAAGGPPDLDSVRVCLGVGGAGGGAVYLGGCVLGGTAHAAGGLLRV